MAEIAFCDKIRDCCWINTLKWLIVWQHVYAEAYSCVIL